MVLRQLARVHEFKFLSEEEIRAAKVLGYDSEAAWAARDVVGKRPPEEQHGGVRGTVWRDLTKDQQHAAINLGYNGSGWDSTQFEHKQAGERKYAKAQRDIITKCEAAQMERAAVAKSALLRERVKEEKEWRVKEEAARKVKDAEARQRARVEAEAQARKFTAAHRKEAKRLKKQQRLAQEMTWEQAHEAKHLAQLAVRRAAADAEMTRLDELQTSKAVRRARRLQRERTATEARVAAALRKAAMKGGEADYLQGNYANQRDQRQQRGAVRTQAISITLLSPAGWMVTEMLLAVAVAAEDGTARASARAGAGTLCPAALAGTPRRGARVQASSQGQGRGAAGGEPAAELSEQRGHLHHIDAALRP